MKELVKIQTELKANKDLFNSFSNYGYRSTETILEALKPFLKELNCIVTLSDEIVEIGQPFTHITQVKKNNQESVSNYNGTRVYVKSTATLINSEGAKMSAVGFAREEVAKAGYDAAQITGSTSSYARKYALCGLFAIDDGRDNDRLASEKQPADAKLKSEFETVKKKLNACKKKQDVVDLNAKYQDLWGYQPYITIRDAKWTQLPE